MFGSTAEALDRARAHIAANPGVQLQTRPLTAVAPQGGTTRVVWRVMTSTGQCAVHTNAGDCAAFPNEQTAQSALAAMPEPLRAACKIRSFYTG